MNIFYAVQATGNGHISRAMELLPHLSNYGKVDIFLSGSNSHLAFDGNVKYRSKGLSLQYTPNGGLDYWKMLKELEIRRLKKEIKELPVEKYDLIINDFEFITASACAEKGLPSINFGHQASFKSSLAPRPDKISKTGEYILRHYAPATHYVGLHFKPFDNFIFTPIIKKLILEAHPTNQGYITVYLPSYGEQELKDIFSPLRDVEFQVFSFDCVQEYTFKNIRFFPISHQAFVNSFISCMGIVTGGGFETPAEALHMGKKIICIPIRRHYEQECNAAALKTMGITTLPKIDSSFKDVFYNWLNEKSTLQIDYSRSIPQSLEYLFNLQP